MLLCDAYTLDTNGAEQGYPAVNEQVPSATDMHGHVGSENRHNGKIDVLFCDVHVKTLPYSYVTAPYGSKASSTNQDIWGHFDW